MLQKLKDPATRLWYAKQTVTQGWSRSALQRQIATRVHERMGRTDQTTNFDRTLTAPQADLVRALLKDPYHFEFLSLPPEAPERHVETELLAHLRDFLVELGMGFAFLGRQYPLTVGGERFLLDLLFYHVRLRAYVVVELKRGKFQPEFAGKMSFYLNAVDALLKHETDGPSIGLILCPDRNAVVAEYTLRDMQRPIGVARYQGSAALPAPLVHSLPSLAAVEAEIQRFEQHHEQDQSKYGHAGEILMDEDVP